MPERKTRAIVLSRRLSGQADKLLHLYTRDLGRMFCRASSALKAEARLKAATEPLRELEVVLWEPAGLVPSGRLKLITAKLLCSFCGPEVLADPLRFAEACACCQAVEALTPLREPAPAIYDFLRDALSVIASPKGEAISSQYREFENRFLRLLGWDPGDPDIRERLASRPVELFLRKFPPAA